MEKGLVSGDNNNSFIGQNSGVCQIEEDTHYNNYSMDGNNYIGKEQPLRLSPKLDGLEDNNWCVSLMMPYSEYRNWAASHQKNIIFFSLAFLIVSILLSYVISRVYVKPIVKGLELIKKPDVDEKCKVFEINDLMEFLAKQDELAEELKGTTKNSTPSSSPIYTTSMYQQFVENINTLSRAERAVFDLYMEGCTATEIAERLFLSINTIKTHNRRIYMKLNVSSRKELLIYIGMMKELDLEE